MHENKSQKRRDYVVCQKKIEKGAGARGMSHIRMITGSSH